MTDLYHITHINNLSSIIQAGGLWCDYHVAQGNVQATSIAYQHIKDRRMQREVKVSKGGTLADYVPFYFAPRSPMLYVIHRGFVEEYQGGQNSILHLVTSAELISKMGLGFTFTDGHADVTISRFFTNLSDLDHIDWDVMQSRYWKTTMEYPDRKRRRQAEFLVHSFLQWELITGIGVRLKKIQQQVQDIIVQSKSSHTPIISVDASWYY